MEGLFGEKERKRKKVSLSGFKTHLNLANIEKHLQLVLPGRQTWLNWHTLTSTNTAYELTNTFNKASTSIGAEKEASLAATQQQVSWKSPSSVWPPHLHDYSWTTNQDTAAPTVRPSIPPPDVCLFISFCSLIILGNSSPSARREPTAANAPQVNTWFNCCTLSVVNLELFLYFPSIASAEPNYLRPCEPGLG